MSFPPQQTPHRVFLPKAPLRNEPESEPIFAMMTSRERLLRALQRQEVDRVPWVPFVGSHAAALLRMRADDYLRSEDDIVRGVQTAIDRYKPDGIPVLFDLQIEAETFGCELNWAEKNPPSVISHPLANGTDLDDLSVPASDAGRIGISLAAARRLREANPDIGLYGSITGPFTLALHLMGTEIFMKMFDQTEYVHRVLALCKETAIAMAQYYIEAGCDIVAVVDPMTSQIGSDQFDEYVLPAVKPVFDSIREQGRLSSFFVCGHAQQNIEAMCRCGPDNISVDENIPLQFVREVCESSGVSFGGNLQLTSVLLLGSELDSQKNAVACLEVAGEQGFVLAPGCDLPYDTPPANLEAIIPVVVEPYQREIVKATEGSVDDQDRLDMREYGQRDRVVVDIITLDSEACAPCQYMVDAVKKVAPEFDGIVEWREHKIKYRESLVFMTSLMVRNVPAICIDGEITFVSRIPPRDELVAAIQRRINQKFRSHLMTNRGKLRVLGPAGGKTDQTLAQIERAIQELGVQVGVEAIHDEDTIASYGITPGQCPAVIAVRQQVKSLGHTPDVAAIKEWIKQLR